MNAIRYIGSYSFAIIILYILFSNKISRDRDRLRNFVMVFI
ncbi:hypothetical protein rpr22_CDSx634 [Rickettsia prowazekii str. Rp22]|uniref:Uncharacterized protein n=1 Tax=Rickettsia prowazekii (strain Rp22) TaxID=449216 RepID=D5AXJ1_RICPP|nr:hypothetical protein rpr22_CDSx634 [Rickettsia prowazekii str. Rp22]